MAQYRVIGRHEVLDHEHGDVFYADLDPVQEARLIAGGHIELVVEERRNDGFSERFGAKNEKNEEQDENDDKVSDEE